MASVKNIWRLGSSLKSLNINKNVCISTVKCISSSSVNNAASNDIPTHTGQVRTNNIYVFKVGPSFINDYFLWNENDFTLVFK